MHCRGGGDPKGTYIQGKCSALSYIPGLCFLFFILNFKPQMMQVAIINNRHFAYFFTVYGPHASWCSGVIAGSVLQEQHTVPRKFVQVMATAVTHKVAYLVWPSLLCYLSSLMYDVSHWLRAWKNLTLPPFLPHPLLWAPHFSLLKKWNKFSLVQTERVGIGMEKQSIPTVWSMFCVQEAWVWSMVLYRPSALPKWCQATSSPE